MKTRELASNLGKQPQTLIARYCRTGSYFGLVPQKLPCGSLMWPDDAIERLIKYAKERGASDRAAKAREAKAVKRAAVEGASQGGAV